MIIACPSCSARFKFDEAKLGSRPRAKTKCSKCGGVIEIENPLAGNYTLPPGISAPAAAPAPPPPAPATDELSRRTAAVPRMREPEEQQGGQTITGRNLHQMGIIELPKDKRYSLALIQGAATGQIHQISRSRTTIGRAGADINLDDPEASRQHAVVEILGDHAILRDLGSTNGTFIDAERIEHHVLTNHQEFRIGSHVLMFIITDVE